MIYVYEDLIRGGFSAYHRDNAQKRGRGTVTTCRSRAEATNIALDESSYGPWVSDPPRSWLIELALWAAGACGIGWVTYGVWTAISADIAAGKGNQLLWGISAWAVICVIWLSCHLIWLWVTPKQFRPQPTAWIIKE